MSVPTVVVTCNAADQGGSQVAFGVYTAKLDQTEIYNGFVVPEVITATANASGVALLNLWPNALGVNGSSYRITARNPDTGKKFFDASGAVPNSPCNLHEILVQAPYPTVDASMQALLTAQGALALVTAKAGEANVSASAALAYRDTVVSYGPFINAVAGALPAVTAVAGVAAQVSQVATAITNVSAVANHISSVVVVAGAIDSVIAVAGVAGHLASVAGVASDIQQVTAVLPAVTAVSGALASINALAPNIANINAVAANATNINAANGYASTASTKAFQAAESAAFAAAGLLEMGQIYDRIVEVIQAEELASGTQLIFKRNMPTLT